MFGSMGRNRGFLRGWTLMATDVSQLNQAVQEASGFVRDLVAEIDKVIVGQRTMIERLLVGLLANGHVLLEGVPGLAKTLAVRTLAGAIQAGFQRIQFTPDLLPADVIGTQIYNPGSGEFSVKRGPVFTNIVLADEINRAPAKVQSALLEAMQERQVTIGQETFTLPEPFLVLATQNPIDQEGTYPLPEAQVDRFMLKLKIDYPTAAEEKEILDRNSATTVTHEVKPVVTPEDIVRTRQVIDDIIFEDRIKDYIVSLVLATRRPDEYKLKIGQYIEYGASPRATIYLALAAKVHAFVRGRGYVLPEDVKAMAMDVLRHRVIITYEAEAEDITSENVVQTILDEMKVP
jgi:MoxR-like ATPase